MKTINRTAITIIPKQPYFDWANSFEGAKTYDTPHVTTILIPDKYGEFDYEVYLKKIFKDVFEEELESWMTDPDRWPKKRTYSLFKNWFKVICADMTWDSGDEEQQLNFFSHKPRKISKSGVPVSHYFVFIL